MNAKNSIIIEDGLTRQVIRMGLVGMGILNASLAEKADIRVYRQVDRKTKKERIGVRVALVGAGDGV